MAPPPRKGRPASRPRRDPRADAGVQRPTRSGARPGNRVAPRRVEKPLTAAEKRAAEVRARRGSRPDRAATEPPPWERERWIDGGSVRDTAKKAVDRASNERPPRRAAPRNLAPDVDAELTAKAASAKDLARYRERLASAAEALDRGRYGDARRMVQPVLKNLPQLAFGHEIAGLCWYSMGEWRKAITELELARSLDRTVNHHPVLADCYRALKRYDEVDELWAELRAASPAPALLAEGRIVAAGAAADRGDLPSALRIMERALDVPKKPKEHHLRQWYVIADLFDRSGDVIKARRYFGLVAQADPGFADVRERLKTLGR